MASQDNGEKSKEKSLFYKEEELVEKAKTLLNDAEKKGIVPIKDFAEIVKTYEKQVKRTKRIVKINDRQQAELSKLNHHLETLSKDLSKYLPKQVYDSIFLGKKTANISSTRKRITVLFSDIINFTKQTSHMEPEELTTVLNRYLSTMFDIAKKHGATIDKTIGDAIMLFFGDPESRGEEQDALACVSMAIEMRESLKHLKDQLQLYDIYLKTFQVRMGIHAGYCTVGNFGSEDRMDYTIIGGTVNLASRLETKADANEILISDEVYSLIKNEIFCSARGALYAKGVTRPINCFKVVDYYKNIHPHEETFVKYDGISLYVDFDQLKEKSNEDAIKALTEVLEKIKKIK